MASSSQKISSPQPDVSRIAGSRLQNPASTPQRPTPASPRCESLPSSSATLPRRSAIFGSSLRATATVPAVCEGRAAAAAATRQIRAAVTTEDATRSAPTDARHSSSLESSGFSIQKHARNWVAGITRRNRRMRYRTWTGEDAAPKYDRHTIRASSASTLKLLAEETSANGCTRAGTPCLSRICASITAAAWSRALRLAMHKTDRPLASLPAYPPSQSDRSAYLDSTDLKTGPASPLWIASTAGASSA